MRMGLSLGLAGRGRQVFSPRLLFRSAEPGFWADVQPSVLWQDTGRTTPVAADGDPVASWALNTASGVIYATQSTAGNRPVYKVDAGGRGYLEFDGATSNRWLVTPSFTPGTDKVQVFAGVRKTSDAAVGVIVEYSTSIASSNGSFALLTAATGVYRYVFSSRGTAEAPALTNDAAYTAPITNVLTGLGDISGDRTTFRINGTQAAQSVTDQGTGNYLSYPLYIGRRAGTSLPLNGRIYGLIVRFGSNLDTSRVLDAERWVARRVGV